MIKILNVQKTPGKYRFFRQIVLLLFAAPALAQQPLSPLPADTVPPAPAFRDSAEVNLRAVKISSQGLEDEVDYGSRDSMWFDVSKKQLHLWGNAHVKYTSIDVKAGYILLDYAKNEISAQPFPDTAGQMTGPPEFDDGQQKFSAAKFRYNFKTQKGIIYEARTLQEDLYVLGEKAKFISGGNSSQDSTAKKKNIIYNSNALLTTCDDAHPHFGIRTKKLKVIPDKLVVVGFSDVEIGGIPTPLVLPFGFFPITKTRKAGLIIPRDFEFADQEGLGIKDWGWYQPVNEHMDVTTYFNAYTSGSWGVTSNVRYKKLYKFESNFQLRYNKRVRESPRADKVAATSFGLNWRHNQDAHAHPTRRFGGSVNIETNRDQNRNFNDYARVFQNQLTSNLTYSQTFPGKPYNFTASFNHTQNTQNRQMTISFPRADFQVQRIFPFKRKVAVGEEKWYEKISLTYAAHLQNTFQTPDTLLFTKQTLQNARAGLQHEANTDFNFKIFKYINVSPSVRYEENWYPFTIEKQLLPRIEYAYKDSVFQDGVLIEVPIDSARTRWGVDTTLRNYGFKTFRKLNAGLSLTTSLFLTKQFKKGWFRGIRHKLTPSLSTGFGPDYTNERYNYFRFVDTDLRADKNKPRRYGIFDDAVYGKPAYSPRDISIGYSLGNVLEMKYYSAKQDTVKRIRIFDNLTFSGSFVPTADSLKWSPINTGGLFRFFKGVVQLSWRAEFDPYLLDTKGVRVNRSVLKEKGKLWRTSRFGFDVNTVFTVSQIRGLFSKKDNAGEEASRVTRPAGATHDDLLGWFDNFRVSHRISFNRAPIFGTNRDTFQLTGNNLTLSGDIPLSAKWSIRAGNISYDFQRKSLVYPEIGFVRDLHCWELNLSWLPDRGVYTFFIGAKSGSLDFLKVPYRKNNFDGRRTTF